MKVKTDYDDNDDSDFEMSDEEIEDEVLAQRNDIVLNIDQLIVEIIYKRKLFMIMPKKLVYHI